MRNFKETDEPEYDCCVLCGAKTAYTRDTPVDQRGGYIEGAGQLCADCYKSVYGRSRNCHA